MRIILLYKNEDLIFSVQSFCKSLHWTRREWQREMCWWTVYTVPFFETGFCCDEKRASPNTVENALKRTQVSAIHVIFGVTTRKCCGLLVAVLAYVCFGFAALLITWLMVGVYICQHVPFSGHFPWSFRFTERFSESLPSYSISAYI